MSLLPLGAFLFAPAAAWLAYRCVAPVDVGFGVVAALVAAPVAFWLWPFVAFALCWPFQTREFRRDFRETFGRKRTPGA